MLNYQHSIFYRRLWCKYDKFCVINGVFLGRAPALPAENALVRRRFFVPPRAPIQGMVFESRPPRLKTPSQEGVFLFRRAPPFRG